MNPEKLSVYCLKYGESTLPESMVFSGGEDEKTVPISFCIYLIRSDERMILVDAGCDTMPGFVMRNFCSPVCVLRELGIAETAITDVIVTHAHHDHIEALKHFTNATVHITAEQYERGQAYMADSMHVHIVEDSYLLTEAIRVVKWGGHDVGSAIVEIRADDKTHILAGDECYTNANILQNVPTGVSVDNQKSVEFLEKYGNRHFVIHTCHDHSLKTERIVYYESDTGKRRQKSSMGQRPRRCLRRGRLPCEN